MPNDQNDVKLLETQNGQIKYSNDCFYEGDFYETNNKKIKHGKGKLIFYSLFNSQKFEESYFGDWKNNQKNGHGVYKYINNASYEGEWKDDCQEGFGIYFFADGSYYEGLWKDHKMHGKGVYVDVKARRWIGEFRNGCFESNKQKKFAHETILATKVGAFKSKLESFLTCCYLAIEKDKKGLKEIVKKSLSSEIGNESVSILNEKALKFEDKKPETW